MAASIVLPPIEPRTIAVIVGYSIRLVPIVIAVVIVVVVVVVITITVPVLIVIVSLREE